MRRWLGSHTDGIVMSSGEFEGSGRGFLADVVDSAGSYFCGCLWRQ